MTAGAEAEPARAATRGQRQETAAFTSSMTVFSTTALHFWSAYDTGPGAAPAWASSRAPPGYLARDTLNAVWPQLHLPKGVRQAWEERHPQLRATAAGAA
ncbi:MAG: hypothetical protein ACRDPY_30470 [Streptosporangiaceae bacterium]